MEKREQIEMIAEEIRKCEKCGLCKTALNAVPGEGNIDSKIVFVGEAPGRNEDESGRPFVGRAGKLLESMLSNISLKREDVWIGNIIKHRPPENRDPLPEEIQACEGFLEKQLNVIKPKIVITLGRFSMNYFYPEGKISKDRGRLIKLKNYYVYPIYHPAAALRNPTMMMGFKEDFMNVPKVLEYIEKKDSAKAEDTYSDGQLTLGL